MRKFKLRGWTPALLGLSTLLAACGTTKTQVYAVDGSRSDAVVDVAYDPGTEGVTASDEQRGLALAKSKCAAWGYTGSEAFGGRNAICLSFSALGCSSYRTVVKYQCQGSPDSVQPFGLPPSAGQDSRTRLDKNEEIDALSRQNLPYDEYQRRYQAIMMH